MGVKIREVFSNDINLGLLDLFVEGYHFHKNGRPDIFSDKSEEKLKESLVESLTKNKIIIIEEDNEIVGYASYHVKDKQLKRVLWVDELVISESHRGKGYGKKLISELEKITKKNECSAMEFCCWEFNRNAQEMYEHLGYQVQRKIYEKEVQ